VLAECFLSLEPPEEKESMQARRQQRKRHNQDKDVRCIQKNAGKESPAMTAPREET
jgi:hypothetical protein